MLLATTLEAEGTAVDIDRAAVVEGQRGADEGGARATRLDERAGVVDGAPRAVKTLTTEEHPGGRTEGQVDLVVNGALVAEGATATHDDFAGAVDHRRLAGGIVDCTSADALASGPTDGNPTVSRQRPRPILGPARPAHRPGHHQVPAAPQRPSAPGQAIADGRRLSGISERELARGDCKCFLALQVEDLSALILIVGDRDRRVRGWNADVVGCCRQVILIPVGSSEPRRGTSAASPVDGARGRRLCQVGIHQQQSDADQKCPQEGKEKKPGLPSGPPRSQQSLHD